MTKQNNEMIDAIASTGIAKRGDLEWLTRTTVPAEERSEVVDALIALTAKMTESPFHAHRIAHELAWFFTNVLGLEKHTVRLVTKLAEGPRIAADMRSALIMRLVELRSTDVELMPPKNENEDEMDMANILVQWSQQRFQLKEPADAVVLLVHGIVRLCMTSKDPDAAMATSINILNDMRNAMRDVLQTTKST